MARMENRVEQALKSVRTAGFTVLEGASGGQKGAEINVELEEFLKLPVQSIPVVFSNVVMLDETDFQYTPEDPRPFREVIAKVGQEPEPMDLMKVKPGLKRYQTYFGTPSFVVLIAPLGGVLVKCYVAQEWYDDMSEAVSNAEVAAEEKIARQKEKDKAAEDAALEEQIQKFWLLLDDGPFLKLARVKSTTLRALMVFAKQRYPEEAEAIGETRLKEIVTEIRDRIRFSEAGS